MTFDIFAVRVARGEPTKRWRMSLAEAEDFRATFPHPILSVEELPFVGGSTFLEITYRYAKKRRRLRLFPNWTLA